MTELKTRPTDQAVEDFLAGIADERRRHDCLTLVELMARATGAAPVMWGASIVGFGRSRYRSGSGHGGDWFVAGFSPRKADLALYIMSGFEGHHDLLARLGRHRTGKACLYLKRLADIDLTALEELVRRSVEQVSRAAANEPAPPGCGGSNR